MRTAQIVKCKCGSVIAACIVPLCYEDREWQKDIRDFKDQGYTIDELPCDGSWHVGQCECADLPVNSFTKNEIRAAIWNIVMRTGWMIKNRKNVRMISLVNS